MSFKGVHTCHLKQPYSKSHLDEGHNVLLLLKLFY